MGSSSEHDVLILGLQLDGGPDTDAEELDALTRRLRTELLEFDVQSVELVRGGEPPAGTRGADVLAIGGLLVSLVRSGDKLKMLVGVIQSWVNAQPTRTVELQMEGDTLKLSGISSADQARLIELFIQRHEIDRDKPGS
jgi:hypothetical protein